MADCVLSSAAHPSAHRSSADSRPARCQQSHGRPVCGRYAKGAELFREASSDAGRRTQNKLSSLASCRRLSSLRQNLMNVDSRRIGPIRTFAAGRKACVTVPSMMQFSIFRVSAALLLLTVPAIAAEPGNTAHGLSGFLCDLLVREPFIALFLCLGFGHLLARVK